MTSSGKPNCVATPLILIGASSILKFGLIRSSTGTWRSSSRDSALRRSISSNESTTIEAIRASTAARSSPSVLNGPTKMISRGAKPAASAVFSSVNELTSAPDPNKRN